MPTNKFDPILGKVRRSDLGWEQCWFGGGNDGATTFNGGGTTTLARNYFATNCTVSNSTYVQTRGWILGGTGTLTINSGCTVGLYGTAGTNAISSTGATAPSSQEFRFLPWGVSSYASSGNGGNGGTTAGTQGAQSTNGANGQCSNSGTSGGYGGAGGSGTSGSGGVQQNGGTVNYFPMDNPVLFMNWMYVYYGQSYSQIGTGNGGSGGGGGGGNSTQAGGGGGSGGFPGGFVIISFPTIVNNGTISVAGGIGGNGYVGGGSNCGGGGGGGGGAGGVLWMFYLNYSGTGTITAAGGAGGTHGNSGGGSGVNGSDGNAGYQGIIRRCNLATGQVLTS